MTVGQVLEVFTEDSDREILLTEKPLSAYLLRDRNETLSEEEVEAIISFCERIGHLAAKDLAEIARYEKELSEE